MKLIEQLQRLDRLDSLIRRKATGTPEQLAAKFGCSKRTIYNLMQALKHFEAEMAYCKEQPMNGLGAIYRFLLIMRSWKAAC